MDYKSVQFAIAIYEAKKRAVIKKITSCDSGMK